MKPAGAHMPIRLVSLLFLCCLGALLMIMLPQNAQAHQLFCTPDSGEESTETESPPPLLATGPDDSWSETSANICTAEGDYNDGTLYVTQCDLKKLAGETINDPFDFISFGPVSLVICHVENTIGDVFGQLICNMQNYVKGLLGQIIAIFILVTGIGMIISGTSVRELLMRVFKISIIWALATNGDILIGHMYRGIITTMHDIINIVVFNLSNNLTGGGGITRCTGLETDLFGCVLGSTEEVAPPSGSATDVIYNIDYTFGIIFGTDGGTVMKQILFLALFPGLQFLVMPYMGMIMMGLAVFARAILSYIMALVGLTFLLMLAPIFLGMAFFQITQKFFLGWLQHVISFMIQPIIIFATLTLVYVQLNPVMDPMKGVSDRIVCVPWVETEILGLIAFKLNSYAWRPTPEIVGGEEEPPIKVFDIATNPSIAHKVFLDLIFVILSTLLISGVSDSLLRASPQLSRRMSAMAGRMTSAMGGFSPAVVGAAHRRERQMIMGRNYDGGMVDSFLTGMDRGMKNAKGNNFDKYVAGAKSGWQEARNDFESRLYGRPVSGPGYIKRKPGGEV